MHAQTEVLAAARAALGTSETSGDTSSSTRAGGTATLEQPSAYPPTSIPQQPGGVGAPSSSGSSPAASASRSSDGYGGSSSSPAGSSDAGGEPLTRRWSPLSEDQDLTRHVLQNALDQMQKSGAPIAAPKEEPPVEPTPSSSRSSTPSGSSSTTRPPGSSGSSSGGASGGGGSSSSSGSTRRSRDLRSSGRGGGLVMEDGHGPAPSWAQSLLGEYRQAEGGVEECTASSCMHSGFIRQAAQPDESGRLLPLCWDWCNQVSRCWQGETTMGLVEPPPVWPQQQRNEQNCLRLAVHTRHVIWYMLPLFASLRTASINPADGCCCCCCCCCDASGSDDFGGAGYNFPTGGGSGSPVASVLEPQMQMQQVRHEHFCNNCHNCNCYLHRNAEASAVFGAMLQSAYVVGNKGHLLQPTCVEHKSCIKHVVCGLW